MRKYFIFSLLLLLTSYSLNSHLYSQKKQLDHTVYDGWKSLSGVTVSDDGKVVATLISPQEGDTALFIQKVDGRHFKPGASITIDRVRSYKLSSDGRWTVGLLKAPFAERRQARIDKKKKEDVPQDSLLIIDNQSFESYKIPGVKSYRTADELGSHIAYTIDTPKDTTDKKSSKQTETVILRNLLTQQEDSFKNVKQ